MAGRPVVRTARVNPDSRELFGEVFGTALHAYRAMGLGGSMTYPVFRRAWDGKLVTPRVVEDLEQSWKLWTERLIRRVGSSGA